MADQTHISLFPSLLVLSLGVLFQVANFDWISYRDILRLWPVLLIALGARAVWRSLHKQEEKNEQEQ